MLIPFGLHTDGCSYHLAFMPVDAHTLLLALFYYLITLRSPNFAVSSLEQFKVLPQIVSLLLMIMVFCSELLNYLFLCNKTNRCTNFKNLFWHETLHVSDSHLSIISSLFTVQSAMVYVIQWSCAKAVYKPVWHVPLLSVQWINSWWWTDELSETWRVSWQNKFLKLVHLVGFITKKFVTMHGHTNMNYSCLFPCTVC